MKILENEYDIALSHSEEGMVDTMCNLSLGIAKENAYKGLQKGILIGEQKMGKLVQILIKEGNTEIIQNAMDDTDLRESLYKKYHIQ